MLASLVVGCVLRPEWQKLIAHGELNSYWLDSEPFRHRIFSNKKPGTHLRVLIGGDGNPWIRNRRVAIDPTPTDPLLLRLMLELEQPAVYLGRPCFFGSASDRNCDSRWWTFDRYGDAVVTSMCSAVNQLQQQSGAMSVILIGYSGGAALALRMRACTENLIEITTLAGNLLPHAWTDHHGFSPLNAMPPMSAASSVDSLRETHWQCRDDTNVPPAITDPYFEARPSADRRVVAGCTHGEGWETHWQEIAGSDGIL